MTQVRTLRQKSARIPNPTLSELQNLRGKRETGGNDQTRPPRGESKKNATQFFLRMDFGWGGTNWYFEYQLVLAQKYHRRVGSGRVAMFEW